MKKRLVMLVLMLGLLVVALTGCSEAVQSVVAPSYGTELSYSGNNVLYYTETVTEAKAKELGDFLVEQGFFASDGNGIDVQVNKNGKTWELRMPIKTGMEQDPEVIETMKLFAKEVSAGVFNGDLVDFHLCNDNLETIRVVN